MNRQKCGISVQWNIIQWQKIMKYWYKYGWILKTFYERSQSQKATSTYMKCPNKKSIEKESRSVVARAGGREKWGMTASEYGFL